MSPQPRPRQTNNTRAPRTAALGVLVLRVLLHVLLAVVALIFVFGMLLIVFFGDGVGVGGFFLVFGSLGVLGVLAVVIDVLRHPYPPRRPRIDAGKKMPVHRRRRTSRTDMTRRLADTGRNSLPDLIVLGIMFGDAFLVGHLYPTDYVVGGIVLFGILSLAAVFASIAAAVSSGRVPRGAARLLPARERENCVEEWRAWLLDLRADRVPWHRRALEVVSLLVRAVPAHSVPNSAVPRRQPRNGTRITGQRGFREIWNAESYSLAAWVDG